MASLMETLIDNLQQQHDGYKEVVSLQDDKRNGIIQNDLDQVKAVTDIEHEVAGKLARLERERIQLVKDIALVLNKQEDDITLSRLAELLKGNQEEQERVLRLKDSILNLVQELKVKNAENTKLIQHALDYIDFTVNAVHGARNMPEGNGYTPGGVSVHAKGGGSNYFDAKQ